MTLLQSMSDMFISNVLQVKHIEKLDMFKERKWKEDMCTTINFVIKNE